MVDIARKTGGLAGLKVRIGGGFEITRIKPDAGACVCGYYVDIGDILLSDAWANEGSDFDRRTLVVHVIDQILRGRA